MKKLIKHYSVAEFLRIDSKNYTDAFKEFSDTTEMKYYLFESKAEKLLAKSGSYLQYRSHVDNIAEVFPMIRERFTGECTELDFSENLTLKPKFEVQDARFCGKQYSLHCSTLPPPPPRYKWNNVCLNTFLNSFQIQLLHSPQNIYTIGKNVYN